MSFSERDIHPLRNGMNVAFKEFNVKGSISIHAVQRFKDRGRTFELNDIFYTLAAFKNQERQRIKDMLAANQAWRGVIKDHRNNLSIPFDLNGRLPKHFIIVTILRKNPDRFKDDEPWREKDWVHLR